MVKINDKNVTLNPSMIWILLKVGKLFIYNTPFVISNCAYDMFDANPNSQDRCLGYHHTWTVIIQGRNFDK